tara:strand:- start:3064 stop:3228 length:165 start_codon:yes stop_codon:yes gene_type:complete
LNKTNPKGKKPIKGYFEQYHWEDYADVPPMAQSEIEIDFIRTNLNLKAWITHVN